MKFLLTEEQMIAAATLRASPDFNKIMSAVADYGEGLVKHLIFMQGGNVDTVRGQAQAVTTILQQIAEAPANLDKLQNTPKT